MPPVAAPAYAGVVTDRRHGGAGRGGRRAGEQGGLFDRSGADEGAAPRPGNGVKRLLVIDGHALAFRSYFGMRQLSTSRGQPTHAVYGFVRTLLRLLREEGDPPVAVVAFDAPAPTFRHERFEAYKAGRAPAPDDLPQQVAIIKRMLDLMGIPRLEVPGLEADDLIGTIARRSADMGYAVEIVTSDRDALQLVDHAVRVRDPDRAETIGPEEVEARYGVRPQQWVDYRALTGDSSDNLPGVKGIGRVAARELLARHGTVDAMLADLDAVTPPSRARKLVAGLDALRLSRELSAIRTDADIDVDPDGWRRRVADREGLRTLLQELEFGSVLAELGLVDRTEYRAVDWRELAANGAIGFVLDGERATAARLIELAVADAGRVATAPDDDAIREALGRPGALDACDAKALAVAARRLGVADARPGDDPLLMAYLIDSSGASPDRLARLHGAGEWGPDAASRAVATAELLRVLGGRLEGAQRDIYEQLERPLQGLLADMELAGVKVDAALLRRQSAELAARIADIEARVREIAGDPKLNLNSRDQVATLLFETLGLRPGQRTATGKRSTAVSALEPLRGEHEAVALILEQRELSKLKGTYLDPLPDLIDAATGRLHTTFNQAVVATGRLSSANPNLQNIPVRGSLGREIRRAFVAEPGTSLIVADYNQIELRVLAHISGEQGLIAAFERSEDIHRSTAAEVFGVDAQAVTPELRRHAKVINFGVLYGMGARRLSQDLDIDLREAERLIATYFERYPRVRAYIDDTLNGCRRQGYVETLLGRRRFIPDILSPNRSAREYAERTAYNMPIQGSAADIMKLAMLALAPALSPLGGRLLLQVHDEVVAEVPTARAQAAAALTRDVMAEAYPLEVPLAAEVGIGPNWLEAK
jgi:DNA polymerase I